MRRLGWLGILLLAGCQNIVGPFQRPRARVDAPGLPVSEQERRARELLALPDESREVAPRSGAVLPQSSPLTK